MSKSLADLPLEILRLIVAELTLQHHRFIVPFAQTYNKSIYAACSEVLEFRRRIPASKRAICDAFPNEEYRPGWTRVEVGTHLDLSYLKLNGSLDWLDALAYEVHGYNLTEADSSHMMQNLSPWGMCHEDNRKILDDLTLQVEALGCQLPYAFIKFCERYNYYRAVLNLPDLCGIPRLSAYLHKVHPLEGVTGYLFDFWYDKHEPSMLGLYLSPDPTKGHAIVETRRWFHGCGYKTGEIPYRMTSLSIKDANGRIHESCHHPDVSEVPFLCFDFETWLAAFVCYNACWYHGAADWGEAHPHGSLRRANFLQCIAANPVLKEEGWFEEFDEDIRELVLEGRCRGPHDSGTCGHCCDVFRQTA